MGCDGVSDLRLQSCRTTLMRSFFFSSFSPHSSPTHLRLVTRVSMSLTSCSWVGGIVLQVQCAYRLCLSHAEQLAHAAVPTGRPRRLRQQGGDRACAGSHRGPPDLVTLSLSLLSLIADTHTRATSIPTDRRARTLDTPHVRTHNMLKGCGAGRWAPRSPSPCPHAQVHDLVPGGALRRGGR